MLGGRETTKYLAESGIMKRERPRVPRETLDKLVELNFETLIEDVLAPQMTIDSRLFDLFSVAFIRPEPEVINQFARYNPNALSIVNPNTGRTSMALNIQKAGYGIHSDIQTVAGILGYASTEGAFKGFLDGFRGYVVMDELQDYDLRILNHALNIMELGESSVVQAATGFQIKCDGTFIGLANTPPQSKSVIELQMVLLKLLLKLSSNPYGLPRRLPIFLFGNDFKTVQLRSDPLTWEKHEKAQILIGEYIRFYQSEINKIFDDSRTLSFLNEGLHKDYLDKADEIADEVESSQPLISTFIREQRNGYPKINGYALRLAIRDSLTRLRSMMAKEIVADIIELAGLKRKKILSDNIKSFGKFVSNIDAVLERVTHDEKEIQRLPESYQDIVKMLIRVKEEKISVEDLIEKNYSTSICNQEKKHLHYYFGKRVSIQTINSKIRMFGWEIYEIDGKRIFYKSG